MDQKVVVNCPACLRGNRVVVFKANPKCGACGSDLNRVMAETMRKKQTETPMDLFKSLFGGKF